MQRDHWDPDRCVTAPCIGALIALGTAAASLAQSSSVPEGDSATSGWSAPRTSFGQPDIGGVWDFASITPLERPEQFADRAFMTAAEAAVFARDTLAEVDADRREPDGSLDLRGPAINE